VKKKQKPRRAARPIDHLPLTVDSLRAAYEYLRTTPPFSSWNLPEPEDIQMKVARDRHTAAWHTCCRTGRGRKHTIAVSVKYVGRTEALMATMAHEAIHLHMSLTGMDRGRGEHSAAFHKIAGDVCRIHGFDPKAF